MEADLSTVEGLEAAVWAEDPIDDNAIRRVWGPFDHTFCNACGEPRRMSLIPLFWADRWAKGKVEPVRTRLPQKEPLPALFLAHCGQCAARIVLVFHQGPAGYEVVALPSTFGGLATPHTPEGVAYYLDQAQRCKAVGARSAALAMYRSALEHLVHEQGFTNGTLGSRLADLEHAEEQPTWLDRLDPAFLSTMNRLANWAIHANDGDVARQAALDDSLLRQVHELFGELLEEVYERPHKQAERLKRMKEALDAVSSDRLEHPPGG